MNDEAQVKENSEETQASTTELTQEQPRDERDAKILELERKLNELESKYKKANEGLYGYIVNQGNQSNQEVPEQQVNSISREELFNQAVQENLGLFNKIVYGTEEGVITHVEQKQ